ncbi:hypothetical protein NHX12_002840 [Muraenolepis orangiensis]|uniref:Uncharacterized protein n=1 Tax=Muraenolepis orangiensis TaxID=630683 RepID=A0A9Q0DZK8_9TELE|nr:hypothetical protein NHX12_002840 [Muraenolepis orangiensis]
MSCMVEPDGLCTTGRGGPFILDTAGRKMDMGLCGPYHTEGCPLVVVSDAPGQTVEWEVKRTARLKPSIVPRGRTKRVSRMDIKHKAFYFA